MYYFLKSNGIDIFLMILMEVYDGWIIFIIVIVGYLYVFLIFVFVFEFDIIWMLIIKICVIFGRKEIENGYECRGLVFDRKWFRGFYGIY